MDLKEFVLVNIGFIPLKNLSGEIDILNNKVNIILDTDCSEDEEKKIQLFFQRLLKKPVNISICSNNTIDYLVNNWYNLIKGNVLEQYLSLISPKIENNLLKLYTSSEYLKNKLINRRHQLDMFIKRYINLKNDFEIVVDNKLNPEEEEVSYKELYTNQNNNVLNSKNNSIIIGNVIKKIPAPINRISLTEGSYSVIKGKIFRIEYIPKSKICTLYITDNENSFLLKQFDVSGEKIYSSIKEGDFIIAEGIIFYDKYINDFALKPTNINKTEDCFFRNDNSKQKRVELHCHTKLSQMNGIIDIKDLISIISKWGHKSLAITDNGCIQNIPDFYSLASKNNIKPIFGIEANVVNEFIKITDIIIEDQNFDETEFVVFDLETTGLISDQDEIIEIGAVKLLNGEIIDKFHSLIKPNKKIPLKITELTGITEEMLENENDIKKILPEFLKFIDKSVLVAHNTDFDYPFLRDNVRKIYNKEFKQSYIDTLALSKSLLNLKIYKLDNIVKFFKLGSFKHHRADEDAEVTAKVFLRLLDMAKNRDINSIKGLDKLKKFVDINSIWPNHMTILVKNKKGLKNLYKLVSNSYTEYFYKEPRMLKSELIKNRDGLIIGSGCEKGELTEKYMSGATKDDLIKLAKFYDFIEIMPLDSVEIYSNPNKEKLIRMYNTFYEIGKELNIDVVMSSNAHYIDKSHCLFRNAMKIADDKPYMNSIKFLRTTEEMLEAAKEIFNDDNITEEIVIKNTNKIADNIETIKPLSKKLNPPKIDNSDSIVRELTMKKAYDLYGNPLPDIIDKRIQKELNSIINHGYAVLYLMAEKIVSKSVEDGYLVGSRGSVGSSLVATLMGITEVNPMPPHYLCSKCKKTIFFTDGEYGSGFDLPNKICEICNIPFSKNGQDIPFETFMGFEGDKIPDIDLNFSGEYQNTAHKYVEKMFGEDHVFRAGTISTVKERTALEYARKYFEKSGLSSKISETYRIASYITGVKRTTGQHPGGLMIVPKEFDVYDFTPVQYPANDKKSGTKTTHFDYHVIHDDLVKLDALGHDDPTIIKLLYDLTNINPLDIPMDDKETMSIFSSSKALKVNLMKELNTPIGSLGIPEFGTDFVRRMLEDTKPKTFSELVRISGLSHGTDVWNGNAQKLINSNTATLKDVISCRDDIMNFLIQKNMDKKEAFFIMEKVRKGKGLNKNDLENMKKHNVPEWFINSCKLIKYLFPKAHAAAYVSMAFRVAWYKVHYPLEYYSVYFSIKGDEFNLNEILKGKQGIKQRILELRNGELDLKKKNEKIILEIALEMILRGYSFKNVDLYKSDSKNFIIEGKSLLIPFLKIPNLGIKAAESIIELRNKSGFQSIEDLMSKTSLNKTNIELMKELNIFKDLPEKNQMSLFGG